MRSLSEVLKGDGMIAKWVDFLCRTDEELKIFERDFYITDSNIRNVWNYSRFLKASGQRGNITVEELNEAIEEKHYYALLLLIEELFVEPLPKSWESYLQNAIQKYNITGQDIMNWHDGKNRPHAIFFNPHILKLRQMEFEINKEKLQEYF